MKFAFLVLPHGCFVEYECICGYSLLQLSLGWQTGLLCIKTCEKRCSLTKEGSLYMSKC